MFQNVTNAESYQSSNAVLFSCRTNIVEAHTQVQSLLQAEYTSEEIQIINLKPIHDLQTELDNLL